MGIEKIGTAAGWQVARQIERHSLKNGHATLTTIRNNRFVIRTDLNNGKYARSVVEMNKSGIATNAYSDILLRDSSKLKAKLASFLSL